MIKAETTQLRDNHTISRVIKGGWQLAGDHGSVDRQSAIADMEAFLDAGITTFDCADIYTGVEEMIGEFIADIRSRRGAELADSICVHTKLVPDLTLLHDLSFEEVESIIDRSLKRLQIDSLHLVQFFWWDMSIGDPVQSLEVLKKLQQKGKIRNLGVTNWDIKDIKQFSDAGFDIASNQVQYSILDHRAENGLVNWSRENNFQLICFGVLAGGFLTDNWLGKPDPGFSFKNRSLIKYRLIIDEYGSWEHFQTLLNTLKAIGDKYGVPLSAVAIRYVLERPQVAATIVGARYARHLPATLDAFRFSLDQEDYDILKIITDRSRGPNGPVFGLEGDRNGRHGSIMKYNLNTNPDTKTAREIL
ncbi:MAG: aryl-alcohol dehydrogenase-like predicted oxidoreductase [Enterobacterales bacterium]|jgi:aryl-alcohol dehydrogenase-like predicted oxidoreductase